MQNNIFVLYLRGIVIGTFNNEHLLKCFIDGSIQNNFFRNEDTRIDQFEMNTIYNLSKKEDIVVNKEVVNNEVVNNEDIERIMIQEKLMKNRKEIKLTYAEIKANNEKVEYEANEAKIRKQKLEETDEYKKMQQDKIDITHQINKLKLEQKKLKEAEVEYNINLNLYKKFSEEINKDAEKFKIPELFTLKYNIYERLDKENNLNFESYKAIWDKEKPKNEYELFKSNPYEDAFVSNKEEENVEIELEIPI